MIENEYWRQFVLKIWDEGVAMDRDTDDIIRDIVKYTKLNWQDIAEHIYEQRLKHTRS